MINKYEADKRVNEIAKTLLPKIYKTLSREDILHIITSEYDVGYEMAKKYLGRAWKILHDEAIENQDETIGMIIHRYQSLYEKAVEMEDYKEARALTRELHEILGFKKNKIEISGDLKDLFKAVEGLADDNDGND